MESDAQPPSLFPSDCGAPFDLKPENTITSWESLPTSPAEVAVFDFLRSEQLQWRQKRLLHVGMGNSSLAETFAAGLAEYVGITISLPEIERFKSKLANAGNAHVIFLNKYDARMYPKIRGDFDVIVDTSLKSYACCERHFDQMMQFFAGKLRSGGTLITTEKGVMCGWRGNTQRAYTPGAQTDPAIAPHRILGHEGLERLSQRLGLTISSVEVPDPWVASKVKDRILVLTKQ